VRISVGVAHRFQRNNEWEEETSWITCIAWREHAENIADSITKGMRVIVYGRMSQRSWEKEDGTKGWAYELQIEAIGPELRWAKATVERNPKGQGGGRPSSGGSQAAPARDWGNEEEPF
jgi:single-strand DNA-binding protein